MRDADVFDPKLSGVLAQAGHVGQLDLNGAVEQWDPDTRSQHGLGNDVTEGIAAARRTGDEGQGAVVALLARQLRPPRSGRG